MTRYLCIFLILWLFGCGASRINHDISLQNRSLDQKLRSDTPDHEGTKTSEVLEQKESALNLNVPLSDKKMMPTNGHKMTSSMEDFSSEEGIGNILSFLASDKLKGRDSGSEGLDEAAKLIEYSFKEYGIAPYFSNYSDTLDNYEMTAYNIVGFVPGNDKNLKHEFLVIGAHYDHIGIIEPFAGDTIANGANDNASGTTTVLELARYFGNKRSNKRSIIFAFFSAEEKGLLGSEHLAKKLKAENLDLYVMLNFEMVGVPLVNKDYFMYVTGYELSNLAEVGNQFVGSNLIGYLPQAKELNLFKRSDNYPFHTEFNVPSQTFCTFDFTNFDQYHKVGDEASLMDFKHMASLVNKSIPLIESIANSPTNVIKYK